MPPGPIGISCMSLSHDWGLVFVKLMVLIMQGNEADCASTRFWGLLVFLFLVEEENNVGDVAQSEKSPENSQ